MSDNPHAFPLGFPGSNHAGMSLRDYFAGQALSGLLAHAEADFVPLEEKNLSVIAEDAYRLADAMLAARRPNRSD